MSELLTQFLSFSFLIYEMELKTKPTSESFYYISVR